MGAASAGGNQADAQQKKGKRSIQNILTNPQIPIPKL